MKKVLITLASVAVVGCAALADGSGATGQASGIDPNAKFGFTFFRNNGEQGVFLATSADGLNWKEANDGKPVLPAILDDRITRDPSVCLGPDGKYHMTFTTSWKHRGFGVAHSDDLIHWTKPEFVGINEDWPEAANTWAPEILWDASARRYVVIYATAEAKDRKHHRQYFTTTTDFKTWTPRQLYFENATAVIDSFPVQTNGKWLLVSRDHKALRIVWSKDGLFGPWEPAGVRLDSDACWGEGPSALQLDDGRWIVYFDCTWNKCYGSLVTRDFKTFEPIKVTLPKGIRHGTTFRLKGK